jgi:RNA polymerase sigma factor (sigma-70 family)
MRTVARRLAPPDRGIAAPDAELLARFLDSRDEIAFEALVARHLPAVRAVCRSILRDPNDADDAVQATFLVLVRRAVAVRNRVALGAWLCRVAWRTANRLRGANVRRAQKHPPGLDPDATPGRASQAGTGDVASVLEEEIRLLPERYRLAVLACYATGTPTAEAATRLGWPKGTLLTRLAWARRRLRDRLTRRGVAPAGGFAAMLACWVRTADAAAFAARITAAAVAVASEDPAAKELVSERVSSLTEGVVRTMVGTKIKLVVGIGFLAVALLGLGLGRMTAGTAEGTDKKPPAAALPPAKPADAKEPAAKHAAEAETTRAEPPAAPGGPGNELVVRRPLGSYTKEVPAYGKATVTFTENRIHVVANIRIDKAAFTVTLDADYSVNRESVVYGIITGVDVTGQLDDEEAAEVAVLANAVNDMPFAFRIRTDDDAVAIKDIRFGALGSPAFGRLLGEVIGNNDEDLLMVTGLISGKYKADPNPERNAPLPPARGNQPAPKLKKQPAVGAAAGAIIGY